MEERDSEIEEDMVWKERGRWVGERFKDGGRYGLETEREMGWRKGDERTRNGESEG